MYRLFWIRRCGPPRHAYIVSALIDGGILVGKLGEPLKLDESIRLLQPVASALDYAHSRGIVHRVMNLCSYRDVVQCVHNLGPVRDR